MDNSLTTPWCLQDGWKAWKKALKQSNQLDDEGFEDEAARAAAKMVADAHKNFGSKGKGKGKKAAAADEDEAEPFSLLHKVRRRLCVLPNMLLNSTVPC